MIIANESTKNVKKAASYPPAENINFRALILIISVSIMLVMLPLLNTSPAAWAKPESGKQINSSDKLALEVVEIDSEINSLNERISGLRSKSESLRAQIQKTEDEIRAGRNKLLDKKEKLNARARAIYMNGRSDTLTTLMTSEDFSDFMTRREYVQRVAANDTKLVKETKKRAEELDSLLSDLKTKQRDSEAVLKDMEARKANLEKTKSDRNAKLASAGPKQGEVEEQSKRAASRINEINPPDSSPPPAGGEIEMIATAYSPEEPGLTGTTATGLKAQKGVVAVDPSFIPLGTRVYVEGYGYAIAADTGSAIKGNKIDLCYNTLEEALSFGRRKVKVKILD